MNKSWKKTFAIIYAGQAFSILGSAAVQFAIVWWLTARTESAVTLTLATIALLAPFMLIGPFAGVLIDRYNRKTVMMLADGLVALSAAVLAVAFLLRPDLPVWFIYLMLFVRGIGSAFHNPAMQAAIPTLVPPEMLTQAGGWGQLIQSLGNMLGPVLGAALMGLMPIYTVMLVDIFGALFAIICLLFVRVPDIPRMGEQPRFFADMKQGFLALKGNKPLMALFPSMLLVNILYGPLGALFPLLVLQHFNGAAMHTSISEFVFAGGMLASSVILGAWGGMRRRFLMIAITVVVLGVSCVGGVVMGPEGFWFFVVSCFFIGSCGTFLNVPAIAYIQETTAPDMMGKVMSLIMTTMTTAMPVGLLLAGPVSEVIGVTRWYRWSGAAIIVVGIICRLTTRRYDSVTMTPVRRGDS
jgi:DHA3 family macrolide efflux protein-like MFS transporter